MRQTIKSEPGKQPAIIIQCPNCGKWPLYCCNMSDNMPCPCPCHLMESVIHGLTTKGCELNKQHPELAKTLTLKCDIWTPLPEVLENLKREGKLK